MNFQFGNGKLFIGDGYRSVLLSDNSFSFPHLRFTGSFLKGRMQYTVVHAALQNMIRMREFSSPEGLFEKKAASFMYLSFQVNKKLQLGLFEVSLVYLKEQCIEGIPTIKNYYRLMFSIYNLLLD